MLDNFFTQSPIHGSSLHARNNVLQSFQHEDMNDLQKNLKDYDSQKREEEYTHFINEFDPHISDF